MTRILLVDDDPVSVQIFTLILHQGGYEVISSPNGNHALALMETEPFDLLITDLYMPDHEGIALIREIRRDYPHVKIIAISGGYSADTDVGNLLKIAQSLGADAVFQKPVNTDLLRDTVRSLVPRRED